MPSGGGITKPKPLSAGAKSDVDVDTIFPLLVNQDKLTSRFRGGGGCDSRAAQKKLDKRGTAADRQAPQPSPTVASTPRSVPGKVGGPDGRGGGGDNGGVGQDPGGVGQDPGPGGSTGSDN